MPASPESSEAVRVFDREATRYDAWFDSPQARVLFRAEVEAIRRLVKGLAGPWLEVGVGTGRFAQALAIPYGVDPARSVLQLARRRGVHVVQGRGEALPFLDGIFGSVLLIVTLCFADPLSLLEEAKRVLAPGGGLIVADILRDSPWGRWYLDKKAAGHLFYRHATFYSLEELQELLARASLALAGASSTLTQPPGELPTAEPAYDGIRLGASFVCLRAGVPGRKDSSLFNAIDDNPEEGYYHKPRFSSNSAAATRSMCRSRYAQRRLTASVKLTSPSLRSLWGAPSGVRSPTGQ